MSKTGAAAAIALLFMLATPGINASESERATAIQACLDCHDYGEDAPAHQVLLGSHGIDGDDEDMAGRRGCLDCHGQSEEHIAEPRNQAPGISFGPRWTTSPAEQDKRCLACHKTDVASHWRHALHMVNNMTCVTCHDIHTPEDSVMLAGQQDEVCTTCHKAQKSGIHDRGASGPENPACSLCHNPHNHEAAEPQMHANQSAGCVFCHNPEQMETLAALNPRAGNYHSVTSDNTRTCIDCHQGISHAPEESAPPLQPKAVSGRSVTLFYPGNASRQWLLREHPGSQPLRQGTDCQRCHRGDEPEIGAALAGDFSPASRVLGVAFSRTGKDLQIDLNWEGLEDEAQLALMWGGPGNREFSLGGCFAACHDEDAGRASQIIYHGGDSTDATMGGLATPGQNVELWRIALDSTKLPAIQITNSHGQQLADKIAVQRQYSEGQWSVSLRLTPGQSSEGIDFSHPGRFTFGIALHGSDNAGREHWVSLPMSLSFGGHNTDFTAE